MSFIKHKYRYLGLLLGLIPIVIGFISFLQKDKLRKFENEMKNYSDFLDISEDIARDYQKIYVEGDVDGFIKKGLTNCPNQISYNSNVHKSYFRCNQDYLECFLSGKIKGKEPKRKYRVKNREIVIRPLPFKDGKLTKKALPTRGSLWPHYNHGVLVRLGLNEKYMTTIFMENQCEMASLPKRKFNFTGTQDYFSKMSSWHWDSFSRRIYIDKNVVSQKDFLNWKGVKAAPKRYGHAALTNDIKEMKNFCLTHGKRLMETHIFDASVSFPNLDPNPIQVKNYPYPWSKEKKKGFLYESHNNEQSYKEYLKNLITQENCSWSFSKECKKEFNFIEHSPNSTSYYSVNEVLGGHLEFQENNITKNNLKISSYYLPMKSSWHKIGYRAHFDKEKNEIEEPEGRLDSIGNLENFQGQLFSFRCMKVIDE